MKRYKLLNPLPDAKAGDIYAWNGQGYRNETRTSTVISKIWVENTVDWFQEIKEVEYPVGILEWTTGYGEKTELSKWFGTYQSWCKDNEGGKITKVQNNKGEVFQIGDTVTGGERKPFIIKEFNIGVSGKLCAYSKGDEILRIEPIDDATKVDKTFTPQQINTALDKAYNNLGQTVCEGLIRNNADPIIARFKQILFNNL